MKIRIPTPGNYLIFRHSLRMLWMTAGIGMIPQPTGVRLLPQRDPLRRARSPRLAPKEKRSGQRFSYLALDPEETRALNAAYHERITATNPMSFRYFCDIGGYGRFNRADLQALIWSGYTPAGHQA